MFTDITITGMDRGRTYNPKPERTGFFALHFTLSAPAPADWIQIANVRHLSSPFATCLCRVRAEARHIVAECTLDQAQGVVDALKPILVAVNEEYRQHATRQAAAEARRREAEAARESAIREAADALRFD